MSLRVTSMGRKRPLLVILLVVASVGIVPQAIGASSDDWVDNCNEAEVSSTSGEYVGSIDSPRDRDVIKFRLKKGEYISSSMLIPEEEDTFDIIEIDAEGTFDDVENADNTDTILHASDGPVTVSFKYYAEEDGTHCLQIQDGGENADIPYQWRMNVNYNNPEPAQFEVTKYREQVVELESKLQQKNQTISELESRISELESQSSNSGSGDVNIHVSVNPANGQQSFVEGGEALIQAESENADVSEMSIQYGSGTYQLGSSGQVAVPLAQTGTQEMTLVYGDNRKQVSFEVQAQGEQNQQDTTPTGTSGPGFGIVVALIALFGSASILRRYRQL